MPSSSKSKISNTKKTQLTTLNPPSFTLPSDFHTNPSRYELWSIRVPVDFNATDLNGVKLHIDSAVLNGDAGAGGTSLLSSFKVNGKSHGLSVGHVSESNSFRLLAPSSSSKGKSSNEEDIYEEEEKKDKKLSVVPHPFDKHLNLTDITGHELIETDLAPSMEKAPAPNTQDMKLRLAYAHVPQVDGLKRRWRIPGGGASAGLGGAGAGGSPKKRKIDETKQTLKKEKVKEEEKEKEEMEELKTPSSKKRKKEHKKSHKKSHKKDKKKEKRK